MICGVSAEKCPGAAVRGVSLTPPRNDINNFHQGELACSINKLCNVYALSSSPAWPTPSRNNLNNLPHNSSRLKSGSPCSSIASAHIATIADCSACFAPLISNNKPAWKRSITRPRVVWFAQRSRRSSAATGFVLAITCTSQDRPALEKAGSHCAFGHAACRQGLSVRYQRTGRLLDELRIARGDGSYSKLLRQLARLDLLILDDFGLKPLAQNERHDLLEVIEDRHGSHSTIITSQLPISSWHDYLNDPTVADALLDRLLANAHRLELEG